MNLTVERDTFTANSTTGKLSIDGEFFCYTLEPRADRSKGKPYCIPAGITFQVLLLPSPHFGRITPHLQNVPGFTEVEIHPGNFPKNTEACLLVGEERGVDIVLDSDDAFDALMPLLTAAETINITYIGGPTQ